ncbi:hypothetical protein HDU96_010501, partial [Phlyctochytrium bullatum]
MDAALDRETPSAVAETTPNTKPHPTATPGSTGTAAMRTDSGVAILHPDAVLCIDDTDAVLSVDSTATEQPQPPSTAPKPAAPTIHRIPPPPPTLPPTSAIDIVLAFLSSAGVTPHTPHTLLGQLLVARTRLLYPDRDALHPEEQSYQPPLFLVLNTSVASMSWTACVEALRTGAGVEGVAMMDLGRRLNVWFREGVGAPGTPRRRLAAAAVRQVLGVAAVEGVGGFGFADIWNFPCRDWSRSVLLSAIDTELAEVVVEVVGEARVVLRQPVARARRYVFPEGKGVGKVVGVGEVWRCEGTGERFGMDVAREGDVGQMERHLYVTWDPGYVRYAVGSPLLAPLTRVVRYLGDHGEDGPPVAWNMTHPNGSLGYTTTDPAFRRRGLAAVSGRALVVAQRA